MSSNILTQLVSPPRSKADTIAPAGGGGTPGINLEKLVGESILNRSFNHYKYGRMYQVTENEINQIIAKVHPVSKPRIVTIGASKAWKTAAIIGYALLATSFAMQYQNLREIVIVALLAGLVGAFGLVALAVTSKSKTIAEPEKTESTSEGLAVDEVELLRNYRKSPNKRGILSYSRH